MTTEMIKFGRFFPRPVNHHRHLQLVARKITVMPPAITQGFVHFLTMITSHYHDGIIKLSAGFKAVENFRTESIIEGD